MTRREYQRVVVVLAVATQSLVGDRHGRGGEVDLGKKISANAVGGHHQQVAGAHRNRLRVDGVRYPITDNATGKAIEHHLPVSIGVIEDPVEGVSGPLWLRGAIPVIAADGFAYEVRNRVTLCRCGASKHKPFCDGSHAAVKFDDGALGS